VRHELRELEPAEEDDLRLMMQVKDGSIRAFSQLVRLHRQRVESFLFRLFWDRGKAEDGAQEVFLKLWMSRHRYEARARFTTFLYQVAYRYWLDEARKLKARPVETALPEDDRCRKPPLLASPSTEPFYQLFLKYRQRRIQEAIARLPEAYRSVFVLAHLEERKIAEIAEILQIPQGTVKSRLYTATRMLRKELIETEVKP
jgi:RNA polymerase sigma-70 factor (ECF subfamily)